MFRDVRLALPGLDTVVAGSSSKSLPLLVRAALVMCAGSSTWRPLQRQHQQLNLTPSLHRPEPTLIFEPEPLDGPALVLTSYLWRHQIK
jgi:hypothetical protein